MSRGVEFGRELARKRGFLPRLSRGRFARGKVFDAPVIDCSERLLGSVYLPSDEPDGHLFAQFGVLIL